MSNFNDIKHSERYKNSKQWPQVLSFWLSCLKSEWNLHWRCNRHTALDYTHMIQKRPQVMMDLLFSLTWLLDQSGLITSNSKKESPQLCLVPMSISTAIIYSNHKFPSILQPQLSDMQRQKQHQVYIPAKTYLIWSKATQSVKSPTKLLDNNIQQKANPVNFHHKTCYWRFYNSSNSPTKNFLTWALT